MHRYGQMASTFPRSHLAIEAWKEVTEIGCEVISGDYLKSSFEPPHITAATS